MYEYIYIYIYILDCVMLTYHTISFVSSWTKLEFKSAHFKFRIGRLQSVPEKHHSYNI